MNQVAGPQKRTTHYSGYFTIFGVIGLLVCAVFFSSKAGGRWLIASTERASAPITIPAAKAAQAIVVLTGGDHQIIEAARLYRATGLPVLASGGDGEAAAIKQQLEGEFHVPVRWTETSSLNTEQNALFTTDILAAQNIHKIVLVTHALHMRRARTIFSDSGLEVIPAPTRFSAYEPLEWRDFLPGTEGRKLSKSALHEITGLAWYWLRQITPWRVRSTAAMSATTAK